MSEKVIASVGATMPWMWRMLLQANRRREGETGPTGGHGHISVTETTCRPWGDLSGNRGGHNRDWGVWPGMQP